MGKINKDALRFAGEGGSWRFGQKVCDLTEKIFRRRKHGKIFRVALDYLVKEDLTAAITAYAGLRRTRPADFV